jgi:hypothetical protein
MLSIMNYSPIKIISNPQISKPIYLPEISIVKMDCMLYIMNILKDALIEMGWKCSIISLDKINEYIQLNNSNHYFLFFVASQINRNIVNYKRYILYQLEQNVNNKLSVNYNKLHETKILKHIYDNASLIIDYCQVNINVMKQYYTTNFKLMNIPSKNKSIEYKNDTINDIIYDIIFVGSINKRRESILSKLKEKYNVLIVENIYGEELKRLCNQSNICLNIHYYENAILERVRLNEIMEYGIKIISEKPCKEDINICKYYNSIHFIEIINKPNQNQFDLDELCDTIEKLKTNNIENDHDNNLNELESIFKEDTKIFEDICILPKSIAVITANYGDYDTIKDININNKDYFDWYLFTDCSVNTTHYNVIQYPLHFEYAHNNDFNRLYAKYIKCQALNIDILKKYKYIIWTDSSLKIKNNNLIQDVIHLLKNKKDLYFYDHCCRNNINDEYKLSKKLSKYNNSKLDEQMKKYNEDLFINTSLYETGIFIYKNNVDNIKLFNEWWEENINYSYQCQLSLPYVLWKNNKTPFLLNDANFIKKNIKGSVWNNKLFGTIYKHNEELRNTI